MASPRQLATDLVARPGLTFGWFFPRHRRRNLLLESASVTDDELHGHPGPPNLQARIGDER